MTNKEKIELDKYNRESRIKKVEYEERKERELQEREELRRSRGEDIRGY